MVFFFVAFVSCVTLPGYPQVFEMDSLSGTQRDFGRARRDDYEEGAYHSGGNQGRGGGGAHAGR